MTRAIAVYGLSFLSNRFTHSDISLAEQTILGWGGLRGSVSIALALSIPATLPDREGIIATVFGAVLFTLLVQGLTIQPLLKQLHLLGDQPVRQQYMELIAHQVALNRVLQHLGQIEQRPGIESEFYRYQETLVKGELSRLQSDINQLQDEYPNLSGFMMQQLREELLSIEADTYAEFVRAGRLNQELAPLLETVLEDGGTL
ncbi:cation:proton antiporter [Leptolyngbya sp. FACHB-261]|uniref:cation:proton antiporter domain-containing protein n=1 Tax=Leptolyngbya sp. FACHB-261 TaxID=2692806 RepID=UPI0028C38792|nr:cation:proton antiporter [Leptolyngbya sp. FACHB-261]